MSRSRNVMFVTLAVVAFVTLVAVVVARVRTDPAAPPHGESGSHGH